MIQNRVDGKKYVTVDEMKTTKIDESKPVRVRISKSGLLKLNDSSPVWVLKRSIFYCKITYFVMFTNLFSRPIEFEIHSWNPYLRQDFSTSELFRSCVTNIFSLKITMSNRGRKSSDWNTNVNALNDIQNWFTNWLGFNVSRVYKL